MFSVLNPVSTEMRWFCIVHYARPEISQTVDARIKMGIYTIKSHIIYSNGAIDITNIKAID
jgi:hypothetical protein